MLDLEPAINPMVIRLPLTAPHQLQGRGYVQQGQSSLYLMQGITFTLRGDIIHPNISLPQLRPGQAVELRG